MSMFMPTYEKAKQQARANADYFGHPYYVMTDTNGNYRVTSNKPGQDSLVFTAHPNESDTTI